MIEENRNYNEIRQRNIQRNEEFLNFLFNNENNNLKDKKEENQNQNENKENKKKKLKFIIHKIIDKIKFFIISREEEGQRIIEYINPILFPSPSLIIYGPSNSGKSYICNICLKELTTYPNVQLSCKLASTPRKFFNDIWRSTILSLGTFNMKYFGNSPSFSNEKKLKPITTFSSLVNQLKITLDKQVQFFSTLQNIDKTPCIVYIFDHITDVETIEIGLQEKLLDLGKFAHSNIKVIGIQRTSPITWIQSGHLRLGFSPYSDTQLMKIIEQKIQTYHRQILTSSSSSSSSSLPSLSLLSSSTTTITPSLSLKINNSQLINDKITTYQLLRDDEKDHFILLTRESLPFITFRTRSIDEIWAILTSLWEKYSIPTEGNLFQLPSSKNLETQISSLFQQFTFHSIDSTTFLKSNDISNSSNNNNTSKSKRSLKRNFSIQSIESIESSTSYSPLLPSPITPSTTTTTTITTTPSSTLTIQSNIINMNTLLGNSWCRDIPLMEKTLLLAAFLASNNPQETDSTTFGNELKGRKKKLRAGNDPDEVVNPSTRDVLNSPCTFGLERLLAIYLQIYLSTSHHLLPTLWYSSSLYSSNSENNIIPKNSNSKIRNNGNNNGNNNSGSDLQSNRQITEYKQKMLFYGHQESAIYSTINLLVRKQFLLVRTTGLGIGNSSNIGIGSKNFSHPNSTLLYYCTLNENQAEDIARSISFPLRDFMWCN